MSSHNCKTALVSIIVNCFNGESFLRDALDSVLNQSYSNWELIFWDNRSLDQSRSIFESYADPRFKYFLADSHTTLYAARNSALAQCSGSFICFLDVDDWWAPDRISDQISAFDDPEVGLSCGNYVVANQLRNYQKKRFSAPRPSGFVLDDLLEDYYVALPTLMIRKSSIDQLTYAFNDRYSCIGEFDIAMRLAARWKLIFIETVLAFYRVHGKNYSALNRGVQVEELEHWASSSFVKKSLSKMNNYRYFESFLTYKRALNFAINGEKIKAFENSKRIPWGAKRVILCLTVLMPRDLLRRISVRFS